MSLLCLQSRRERKWNYVAYEEKSESHDNPESGQKWPVLHDTAASIAVIHIRPGVLSYQSASECPAAPSVISRAINWGKLNRIGLYVIEDSGLLGAS